MVRAAALGDLEGPIIRPRNEVGFREDGLSGLTILEHNGHLSIQQLQVPYDMAEEKRLREERATPS